MSLRSIVGLETRRLANAPGVWLACAGFTLLVVAGVAIPYVAVDDPDPEMGAAFLLGPAVDLALPMIVILLTYGAIAGHRSRGSIHVFFAAPVNRTAVFVGILWSRLLIALTIVVIGMLAGGLAILGLYGMPPLGPVVGFVLVTALVATTFTCIGVAVSAAVGSPIRSLATLVGGFVIAHTLWAPAVRGAYALVAGSEPPRSIDFLSNVSPLESYGTAANGILPPSPHLEITVDGGAANAEAVAFVGGHIPAGELAVMVAILISWATLPIVIGLVRFHRADIA